MKIQGNRQSFYQSKKILVTGGAGFIGSNIVQSLLELGSSVVVLDSFNTLYGGNDYNLSGSKGRDIQIIKGDVRDFELLSHVLKDVDLVFHLAAQVSYIDSASMPYDDYDITAKGVLNILEITKQLKKKIKILFASSRMVLGEAKTHVITEEHPTNPLTLYGIHKLTAEKYLSIYHRDYGIPMTIFRITNPYGPHQQVKHGKYSIVGWFIRLAMENKPITIFGTGKQKRDYIYIDDIVSAFIQGGASELANGNIYNLGTGVPTEFRQMAETVVRVAGSGRVEYVPWPKHYEKIETGDLCVDISKIRNDLQWSPTIPLEEGIQKTYHFLHEHQKYFFL